MSDPQSGIQPIDKKNLWSVQIITDREHGEIKVLIPMGSDFEPDKARPNRYFATIVINMTRGLVTHEFEIMAESLDAALDRYAEAANNAGLEYVRGIKDAELRNNLLGAKADVPFPRPASVRLNGG